MHLFKATTVFLGVFSARNFIENEPSHQGVIGLTRNDCQGIESLYAPHRPHFCLATCVSFAAGLGTVRALCRSLPLRIQQDGEESSRRGTFACANTRCCSFCAEVFLLTPVPFSQGLILCWSERIRSTSMWQLVLT